MQNIKCGAIPPSSLLFNRSLETGDINYFVKRGYAYIIPAPRGIGMSEGEWYGVYNPVENLNIYDIIEWAAAEPWYDSKSKIGRTVRANTVSIPVIPGEIREYVIEITPPL